jgi:hypothetical protein
LSVFTIENTTQCIPIFPPRTDQKLETIEFDIQKVQEHLEKLKETRSSGPDQMHPKFLKETAKNIAEPLTKIFQKSIETRKIPNTWKLANVIPLHKKGPTQQVTNYRPISNAFWKSRYIASTELCLSRCSVQSSITSIS